ncbi:MAG: UTRA domain-containing protein, partial [Anaerolineaceae bacterium]
QLSDEDLLLSMRDLDKVPAEIRFDHADQYLEIAYALKDEAELLQIPIGMPLIKVTTISYNAANTRIGVDITLMRADRIRLRGTIFKHSGQNRRQSA